MLDRDLCYKALQSHDARFDGIFFTAVKTKGIYCRPICPARTPAAANCDFYTTAAEAEQAGFRPCLRCRPELAPGYADTEQYSKLLVQALGLDLDLWQGGILEVSKQLGITTRHLRRLFKDQLGISPIQYWQTRRLLAAKQLLTDTRLSMLEVAHQAGFTSLATFNQAFQKHYRLTPTNIRKTVMNQEKVNPLQNPSSATIIVKIPYRPPLNWEQLLGFFEHRAIPGVEFVDPKAGIYRRTLAEPTLGWIEVTQAKSHPHLKDHHYALQLRMSDTLEPRLLDIVDKVRHTFDLDLAPQHLPQGISPDTRLPGCMDPFEMTVRAILGQQITVKAAKTLAQRVTETIGTPLPEGFSPWPELTHTFPRPQAFVAPGIQETLGTLGVIRTRSSAIRALSEYLITKHVQLSRSMAPEPFRKQLLAIKGIGPWTADYILMRTTGWPNVFLDSDIGVLQGLSQCFNREREDLEPIIDYLKNRYTPWLSYLVISLWQGTYQPSDLFLTEVDRALRDEIIL